MKIDPIDIILNPDYKFDKNIYFISGNEETLMLKMKDLIIKNFKDRNHTKIEKIKDITYYKNDYALFDVNKIIIINDTNKISEADLENLSKQKEVFIFYVENSPKIKKLKTVIAKHKGCGLIDCYSLSRELKIKILNYFLQKFNLELSKNIYWVLLDRLDDRFMFLENEIEKLSFLESNKIDGNFIEKVISKNSSKSERIFFELLNDNKKIVSAYNDRIRNQKDVNDLYYSFKQFCYLIIFNNTEGEFNNSVPKYLFREKGYLLGIFNRYNKRKKDLLIKLLVKTERALRLESELCMSVGLRFVLSFKKLTIS